MYLKLVESTGKGEPTTLLLHNNVGDTFNRGEIAGGAWIMLLL